MNLNNKKNIVIKNMSSGIDKQIKNYNFKKGFFKLLELFYFLKDELKLLNYEISKILNNKNKFFLNFYKILAKSNMKNYQEIWIKNSIKFYNNILNKDFYLNFIYLIFGFLENINNKNSLFIILFNQLKKLMDDYNIKKYEIELVYLYYSSIINLIPIEYNLIFEKNIISNIKSLKKLIKSEKYKFLTKSKSQNYLFKFYKILFEYYNNINDSKNYFSWLINCEQYFKEILQDDIKDEIMVLRDKFNIKTNQKFNKKKLLNYSVNKKLKLLKKNNQNNTTLKNKKSINLLKTSKLDIAKTKNKLEYLSKVYNIGYNLNKISKKSNNFIIKTNNLDIYKEKKKNNENKSLKFLQDFVKFKIKRKKICYWNLWDYKFEKIKYNNKYLEYIILYFLRKSNNSLIIEPILFNKRFYLIELNYDKLVDINIKDFLKFKSLKIVSKIHLENNIELNYKINKLNEFIFENSFFFFKLLKINKLSEIENWNINLKNKLVGIEKKIIIKNEFKLKDLNEFYKNYDNISVKSLYKNNSFYISNNSFKSLNFMINHKCFNLISLINIDNIKINNVEINSWNLSDNEKVSFQLVKGLKTSIQKKYNENSINLSRLTYNTKSYRQVSQNKSKSYSVLRSKSKSKNYNSLNNVDSNFSNKKVSLSQLSMKSKTNSYNNIYKTENFINKPKSCKNSTIEHNIINNNKNSNKNKFKINYNHQKNKRFSKYSSNNVNNSISGIVKNYKNLSSIKIQVKKNKIKKSSDSELKDIKYISFLDNKNYNLEIFKYFGEEIKLIQVFFKVHLKIKNLKKNIKVLKSYKNILKNFIIFSLVYNVDDFSIFEIIILKNSIFNNCIINYKKIEKEVLNEDLNNYLLKKLIYYIIENDENNFKKYIQVTFLHEEEKIYNASKIIENYYYFFIKKIYINHIYFKSNSNIFLKVKLDNLKKILIIYLKTFDNNYLGKYSFEFNLSLNFKYIISKIYYIILKNKNKILLNKKLNIELLNKLFTSYLNNNNYYIEKEVNLNPKKNLKNENKSMNTILTYKDFNIDRNNMIGFEIIKSIEKSENINKIDKFVFTDDIIIFKDFFNHNDFLEKIINKRKTWLYQEVISKNKFIIIKKKQYYPHKTIKLSQKTNIFLYKKFEIWNFRIGFKTKNEVTCIIKFLPANSIYLIEFKENYYYLQIKMENLNLCKKRGCLILFFQKKLVKDIDFKKLWFSEIKYTDYMDFKCHCKNN